MKKFRLISLLVILAVASVIPLSTGARLAGGPTWHIVGEADFNGDGNPGIVVGSRVTGEMVVRYLEGMRRVWAATVAGLPPPWRIAGMDDLDHGGSPAIFPGNSITGKVELHDMRGLVNAKSRCLAVRAPPLEPPSSRGLDGCA